MGIACWSQCPRLAFIFFGSGLHLTVGHRKHKTIPARRLGAWPASRKFESRSHPSLLGSIGIRSYLKAKCLQEDFVVILWTHVQTLNFGSPPDFCRVPVGSHRGCVRLYIHPTSMGSASLWWWGGVLPPPSPVDACGGTRIQTTDSFHE